MTPPLSGLRVLELAWQVAGPVCGRLLQMAGAQVSKVERPPQGDPARAREWLFTHLNAGKRSITLDFGRPEGAALLAELIARHDLLLESFSPGALARAGFDQERLSQLNPRLVVVSVSNFGQWGPYRDYRAADIVEYALGGHLYIQGEPDQPPLRHWGEQAQYQAGAVAAVGAAAALLHQRRTGQGQQVEVSIMEVVVSLLESTVELYTHQGQVRRRTGNRYPWTYPVTLLPCADGWVVVNAGSERSWQSFCTMMGRQDLLEDPRYATPAQRVERADEIDALLQPWLSQRTRQQVMAEAQTWRLPFGPVYAPADVLADSQLQARGYFLTATSPQGGRARVPGATVRLSRTPFQPGQEAPRLGQHNQEVYGEELGLPRQQLADLQQRGVI